MFWNLLQVYGTEIGVLIVLAGAVIEAIRRIHKAQKADNERNKEDILKVVNAIDERQRADSELLGRVDERLGLVVEQQKADAERLGRVEERQREDSELLGRVDERLGRVVEQQKADAERLGRVEERQREDSELLGRVDERLGRVVEQQKADAEQLKRVEEGQIRGEEQMKGIGGNMSALQEDIRAIWQMAFGSFLGKKPDQESRNRPNDSSHS